ncbi:MAG TPA: hypothetical protein VKN99_24910 [Polyangia bacterium]|nr:hypothetical protein [Polyangia bacterium]
MTSPPADPLALRHLRLGWVLVLVSSALGLALETLHGFKVQWYLGIVAEPRRLMWTLAHAHGTLLGLLNLALAVTLRVLPDESPRLAALASASLSAASILIPSGFWLGGLYVQGGDPGLGSLLVPLGGLLLLFALALIVRRALRRQRR